MDPYQILQHAQLSEAQFRAQLIHPIRREAYRPRHIYGKLSQFAKQYFTGGHAPRMLGLAGLRGTGKTTLLWQLGEYIFHHFTQKIYFINVNALSALGIGLPEALEYFQQHVLKQRFQTLTEPIAFLLDEVQEDPQWARALKVLFDEARPAFIAYTGSSALQLQSTADLATRQIMKSIYPLSWAEYWELTSPNRIALPSMWEQWPKTLKQALFFSENAQQCLTDLQPILPAMREWNQAVPDWQEHLHLYIRLKNIPRVGDLPTSTLTLQALGELIKRVVYEDLSKIERVAVDGPTVEKLMIRLAGSDEIQPESLAQVLGIKKNTILEIVDLLAKAELIQVLPPHGGIDTKLNKAKKAFFMSPSLRYALLNLVFGEDISPDHQAKLYEDLVALCIRRTLPEQLLSFVSGGKNNADFVIETRDRPVLLEVGTQKKTNRQIAKSPINARYGLMINALSDDISLQGNVIHLPLAWFAFL